MSNDDAALAAAIFHDAGFVVLPNAVDLKLCDELVEVCRQDMFFLGGGWVVGWLVGGGELYLEGMGLYRKLILRG